MIISLFLFLSAKKLFVNIVFQDLQGIGTILLPFCHTRFSKEQNQANHMCAQEVHTYARMKKYHKQCYYITYT
jgi:hypothetical protein